VALQFLEGIDPRQNPKGHNALAAHLIADATRRYRELQQDRSVEPETTAGALGEVSIDQVIVVRPLVEPGDVSVDNSRDISHNQTPSTS
jgi:hypothetical protein